MATGDVKGKYGYVDDTGKVRVVEYGATKYGFAPSGEGITVPPPTLVDESNKDTEDQYYEPAPAPRSVIDILTIVTTEKFEESSSFIFI